MDLYTSLKEDLGGIEQESGLSSVIQREWITIEDHVKFEPSVNQDIELWAVVTQEHYYIRDLESGYLQINGSGFVESIVEEYDQILLENTSYSDYHEKYRRLVAYQNLLFKQTDYMNGKKRRKAGKLKIKLQSLYDFTHSKWFK